MNRKDSVTPLQRLMAASRACEQAGDFEEMRSLAQQAVELKPKNVDAHLRLAEAHWRCCDISKALKLLRRLEPTGGGKPRLAQRLGEFYSDNGLPKDALRCFLKAVEASPDNADCLRKAARLLLTLGEPSKAGRLLERAIFLEPVDHRARYLHSRVERQTPESNHVKELSFALDYLQPGDPGRVSLCYALAKELDDLEHYDEAFVCLREGAAQRALTLNHDVAQDEAAMQEAACKHGSGRADPAGGKGPDLQPIFLVGLPEAGTDLVARGLAAHSGARVLGEIKCLENAVVFSSANALDLGDLYLRSIADLCPDDGRPVDIRPLNFMFLGAIHQSLPGARVIHVHRHPLDICLALFQTLPGKGRAWAHDLQAIGRYFLAYHALMEHWRGRFPGAFLDVDLELLVSARESQVGGVLDYLGLDHASACLEAIGRPSPPIGHWRCYERYLAPLRTTLEAAGIEVN